MAYYYRLKERGGQAEYPIRQSGTGKHQARQAQLTHGCRRLRTFLQKLLSSATTRFTLSRKTRKEVKHSWQRFCLQHLQALAECTCLHPELHQLHTRISQCLDVRGLFCVIRSEMIPRASKPVREATTAQNYVLRFRLNTLIFTRPQSLRILTAAIAVPNIFVKQAIYQP